MKKRMVSAAILLSLAVLSSVSVAQSNAAGVDSYIETVRADTRADKVAIITEAMQLNDKDGKIFWPVYRKYEADLMKVNDQRVALIKAYADKYTTLTDGDAKAMIEQSLNFESGRTEAKRKCAKDLQKAGLAPLTVARFIQLEHRLDLLIDLEIASELPPILNKPAGTASPNQ